MIEYPLKATNGSVLIGIDEVGRGCLAGPVYAGAAVFLSPADVDTYFDSKTLSEVKRKKLSESILANHFVAIGTASVEEIDELNIRQATFLAMQRAVLQIIKHIDEKFRINKAHLLIDGRDTIPNFATYSQEAIIKGDQKVRLISAASIVAKVARDEFMTGLSNSAEYSCYGFEKHKGYGTELHRKLISENGPSVWHRKSFGGVKEYVFK